jgi:Cu/Zn superoxide dismutase
VKGKAIVVHASVDAFSDPARKSGSRIGCGEILPARL